MTRTLRSLGWMLLATALGATAIAVVILKRPSPPSVSPVDLGPVPVRLRRLSLGEARVEVRGYGTLLAARRAALAVEVAGPVVSVHPDWRPGLAVEAGAELCAVDPTPYALEERRAAALLEQAGFSLERARLEEERAEVDRVLAAEALELARASHQRWDEVEAAGHAPMAALDQARAALTGARRDLAAAEGRRDGARVGVGTARAALEQAAAARDNARDRLERTVLRAPFAGQLVGRPPALGTYLAPGLTPGPALAELVDTSVMHLSLQVPEEELARIAPGQGVSVTLPAQPGRRLRGTVAALSASVDPRTRSASVEIDVPNATGGGSGAEELGASLRAGQFAAATIEVERRRDALTIGRGELRWREGQPLAYVLRESPTGSWVEERRLELGPAVANPGAVDGGVDGYIVEGGLLAGEELILWPLERLREGQACRRLDAAGDGRAVSVPGPDSPAAAAAPRGRDDG
jgi:RND family efflux transporter MFP subunit